MLIDVFVLLTQKQKGVMRAHLKDVIPNNIKNPISFSVHSLNFGGKPCPQFTLLRISDTILSCGELKLLGQNGCWVNSAGLPQTFLIGPYGHLI